ncbi:DUF3800 domain-containing protein [uncultured Pseudodesulfovibrio sp.]|uniref:DUF3800 domain-containing protein n=1 Tax=uncultured Pseudodesulfovibrio sp. TaxID=2035858 RepID=UPI0029C7F6B3|nr:DUF3800 domain-containing protein [uncultured Pseudodesulfovibrio sp.]
MPTRHIFIDESGNTSLPTYNNEDSNKYILVAIIVDDDQLEIAKSTALEISKSFFGGAEIKSSKIGKNQKRRRKILLEASKIPFKYYAYIVDKNLIYRSSGLQFKKSFYKYLNGSLHSRLCQTKQHTKIYNDTYGREDFMDSFKSYIRKKFDLSLLQSVDFQYGDSKKYPLIQIADLVAGTIARHLSGKDAPELIDLVSKNKIFTYKWPPSISNPHNLDNLDNKEKFNQIIKEQSVNKAQEYIYNNINSQDIDTLLKVNTLEYLLHCFFVDSSEYVFSDSIISHLGEIGLETINRQKLRSSIIAPLRDNGVIIASKRHKGYKIPHSIQDMKDFVQIVEGVVVPYVERLNTARELMLLASNGSYDIVPSEEYPKLKSYITSSEYK